MHPHAWHGSITQRPPARMCSGPDLAKEAFMWMRVACRVELLEDIQKTTPQAQGRLLVDLINEPDGYSLTWDVSSLPAYATISYSLPAT